MSSREFIKILEANGWYLDSIRGDHWHFKHAFISGKVTVRHPVKTLSRTIIKSIEKQSGIKF
ncbi:MAG: type II toxin-antitoxin system HicA family toxin [Synergistaceae bacterium]|nr:type II toxin-antitoxin system HicA family toxin [Synergistaceae bacterium]